MCVSEVWVKHKRMLVRLTRRVKSQSWLHRGLRGETAREPRDGLARNKESGALKGDRKLTETEVAS